MKIMTIVCPLDYREKFTVLTFTPSNVVHTVTVLLLDDTIVEGSEYFNGNIMGTLNVVIASPKQATVIIDENIATDSEFICNIYILD